MKKNEGSADRIIRVILGLALISLLFLLQGNIRYVGLLGFVFLITGIAGVCPLYMLFKISTNKSK